MNLRRILTPIATGMLLLASAVHARYVFVLPPSTATSPTLQGFTDSLQSMGSVFVPAGASQVLVNLSGDKAIVIAKNPTAAVSFVSITNGQLSGAVRSITLDGQTATAASFTPDGQRLIVLAGSNPGTLYVVDPNSESVLLGGKISVVGAPKDLVITRESRYAVVLSAPPAQYSVVDLNSYQVVTQNAVAGIPGDANISLAPWGSFYITGQFVMAEYAGQPPFDKLAQSSVITSPGKISFSADGRYGVAPNLLLNGSSVAAYDFTVRGVNTPAGAEISKLPIISGSDTIPKRVDTVFTISPNQALAYSSELGKLFLLTYPTLTASDFNPGNAGVPSNAFGLAPSDEVPTMRFGYYGAGAQLYRHDLVTNAGQGSAFVSPGNIFFLPKPTPGTPAQILTYGTGKVVAPNTATMYTVRVVDSSGRPCYSCPIGFTPETTGVLLTNAAMATNTDGWATVTVTSPTTTGEYKVRVTSGLTTTLLTSTVTGGTTGGGGGGTTDPNLPRVVKVSGDGQLVQLMYGFNKPLVIQVVDAAGVPIANKAVTWTESGGVSFANPITQTTDANGMATMGWIAGNSISPGIDFLTYTVVANTDVGNATFILTAYPWATGSFNPQPTALLVKPTQTERTITTRLGAKNEGAIQIIVVTASAVPIPNVALNVTTGNTNPQSGPVAKCDGGIPLTKADGTASCTLIIEGRTGTTALTVDIGNYQLFSDIRLVVNPGDPVAPVITSGNKQSGKPGATLSAPLVIKVTDNYGNLLQGQAVTWEVVTANSVRLYNTISTTDYNGLASTNIQLGSNPGTYQVRANVAGKSATFEVTIEAVATGFAKVSGDNQPVTPIGQQFPQPLVVVVTNAQGSPVAGAVVNWTVSGAATLSATTTPTGTDGRAQVTVTAGSIPGPITVTAAFTGLPSVTYSLQSRLPGPVLTAASFTNYATGEAGIAPGNLILITGPGLAPSITGTLNASLLGGRLPYELGGVTVEFQYGGRSSYAPIYSVAKVNGVESVLVQAPFEINTSSTSAVVNVSGGNTTVNNIAVRSISPGVLEDLISGRRAAVVIRSDGLVVSPETPARRGEEVRLYAIGLGQTSPLAETNRVGQPAQAVRAALAVGVDDKGVPLIRAELAENLVGVYEIVFQIPTDATIGPNRPLGIVLEETPGQPIYSNPSVISIGQ
ncbi:MAG: hypothetical protein HY821_17330 [Acidobacteria bacterium]|nr:hypothetical protein [Acidobacteriota bacterium]